MILNDPACRSTSQLKLYFINNSCNPNERQKIVLKINDEMSDLYLICWWSGQRELDVSVHLHLTDSFDRTPMYVRKKAVRKADTLGRQLCMAQTSIIFLRSQHCREAIPIRQTSL